MTTWNSHTTCWIIKQSIGWQWKRPGQGPAPLLGIQFLVSVHTGQWQRIDEPHGFLPDVVDQMHLLLLIQLLQVCGVWISTWKLFLFLSLTLKCKQIEMICYIGLGYKKWLQPPSSRVINYSQMYFPWERRTMSVSFKLIVHREGWRKRKFENMMTENCKSDWKYQSFVTGIMNR